MSMFNRTVKLQFNRMKYADLKNGFDSSRTYVLDTEVMFSRLFFFTLGFLSMSGVMNFDINKYKLMKGVHRWIHRVQAVFGYHHHGHEHGLVGDYPGSGDHHHGADHGAEHHAHQAGGHI